MPTTVRSPWDSGVDQRSGDGRMPGGRWRNAPDSRRGDQSAPGTLGPVPVQGGSMPPGSPESFRDHRR
jgi:hypothetical protein